jgi:hypothetical protein
MEFTWLAWSSGPGFGSWIPDEVGSLGAVGGNLLILALIEFK